MWWITFNLQWWLNAMIEKYARIVRNIETLAFEFMNFSITHGRIKIVYDLGRNTLDAGRHYDIDTFYWLI